MAEKLASDKFICDLCECEVEIMVSKCMNCDIHLCKCCTKGHTKLKATKDHEIISIQSGPLPNSEDKIVMCRTHPRSEVTYYCNTCNLLVCVDCITSDHQTHKRTEIKEVAKQMEKELSNVLNDIKSIHIPNTMSELQQLNDMRHDNRKRGEVTVEKMKTKKDELVQEVSKICHNLIMESERETEENDVYLNTTHNTLSRRLTEMEDICSNCDTLLSTGSDADKIQAKLDVSLKFANYTPGSFDCNVYTPTFTPGTSDVTLLREAFGCLDTGLDMMSDDDDCNTTEPPFRRRSANSHASADANLPLRTSTDIYVKVLSTFNHRSKVIGAMCPVSEDTALIHCGGEYRNELVNSIGEVQRTIILNHLVEDFIVTSDGILATGNKSIYQFRMDGQQTNVINTAPLETVCLCLASDGNILVTLVDKRSYDVNDKSKRRVARITKDGKTIGIYEHNKKKKLFRFPTCLAENTTGDICVVNRKGDQRGNLIILDNKGTLKFTYTAEARSENFDPVGVTCDTLGHIIVSDCTNRKIHLLSNDGQFIQYLMTSSDLQQRPFSLFVNCQGLLWLGCAKGQVYILKYLKHCTLQNDSNVNEADGFLCDTSL